MTDEDASVVRPLRFGRGTGPRFTAHPAVAFWTVLVVYVTLAILAFGPISPWNNHRLPETLMGGGGFGDPAQMTWFLTWTPYALLHGLNLFHSNFLNYPHGVNLTENTLAPLLGLLGAPVTLTLGPIAAFNILVRLAFASSSLSMYGLLRTWVRRPIAFVGGLVYGFGPYSVTQSQSHLDLVFVPLPPLMVWCLYRLVSGRTTRLWRTGALLGLLASAQFFIDAEILLLVGFTAGVGAVMAILSQPKRFVARLRAFGAAGGAALGVFLVLCGYPISLMLLARDRLSGTVLQIPILQLYRGDLAGLVVPTMNELFKPTKLVAVSSAYVGGNLTENVGYWSAPFVALFVLLLVVRRRDALVRNAGVMAIVAVVMSLGPQLVINSRVTPIALPESLFTHLAFFDDVVPARFALVAWLFAVLAVAVGIERVLAPRRVGDQQRNRVVGATAIALAVASIVMLWPTTPFATAAANFPVDTSAVLAVIPRSSVVLTYPYPVIFDTEAQSWAAQSFMRFRLLGGYATYRTPSGAGAPVPPLLKPAAVQEFWGIARYGGGRYYPVPARGAHVQVALCTFIRRYHVGAIVAWFVGAHPLSVGQLVDRAIGRPTRVSRDRTLAVWLTAQRRCQSS